MGLRDWFKPQREKVPVPSVNPGTYEPESPPIEAGPSLLAIIFLHRVKFHFDSLREQLLSLTGLTLNPHQETALFRQLCLFHDALWRALLQELITRTGRIPREDIPKFLRLFQERCMNVIAEAEDLPPQWRNWGKLNAPEEIPGELNRDVAYYFSGEVPEDFAHEFIGILSFCRAEGWVFERAAYFHMRLRQIAGLEDREKWLFPHLHLWSHQRAIIVEMFETLPKKLIPIPDSGVKETAALMANRETNEDWLRALERLEKYLGQEPMTRKSSLLGVALCLSWCGTRIAMAESLDTKSSPSDEYVQIVMEEEQKLIKNPLLLSEVLGLLSIEFKRIADR